MFHSHRHQCVDDTHVCFRHVTIGVVGSGVSVLSLCYCEHAGVAGVMISVIHSASIALSMDIYRDGDDNTRAHIHPCEDTTNDDVTTTHSPSNTTVTMLYATLIQISAMVNMIDMST